MSLNNSNRDNGKEQLRSSYLTEFVGGPGGFYLEEGGDGGGDPSPNDPPDEGNGLPEEKMVPQSQIDKIVKKRVDRERKKIDQEVQNKWAEVGVTEEDVEELHQLREERKRAAQKRDEDRENWQEQKKTLEKSHNDQLTASEKKRVEAESRLEQRIKKDALSKAALKAGADPENLDMIVTFNANSLKIVDVDSETVQVVGSDGSPIMDTETAEDITLQKFISNFLAERPRLLSASASRGAGTGPSVKAAGYSMDDIKKIAKDNPAKYKELKDEGVVQQIYKKHLAENIN